MGTRRLVFDKEHGKNVAACGACGWVRPYPRLEDKDGLAKAFEQHVCAEHPKKPNTREDVNQAAARIVREATKES